MFGAGRNGRSSSNSAWGRAPGILPAFGKNNNNNNKNNNKKMTSLTTKDSVGFFGRSEDEEELRRRKRILLIKHRLRVALWGYFAGDALASPTHWFYGGLSQIQQYYGYRGITGYTKPVFELAGSIMNKSNLSGGGRATATATTTTTTSAGSIVNSKRKNKKDDHEEDEDKDKDEELPPTIIGHVINHNKQDLWSPRRSIHYHATLQSGENTLEVQLGRVLMKSIIDNDGQFNAKHFQQQYIKFMTTPGSHNDAYASTCHRMFFHNLIYNKLSPEQCPDNDFHNVETIDGLVLPTIVALAVAGHEQGRGERRDGGQQQLSTSIMPLSPIERAARDAQDCVAVTRNSKPLQNAASEWAKLIYRTVQRDEEQDTNDIDDAVFDVAKTLRLRKPTIRRNEEMTACYLDTALPALLDGIMKYQYRRQLPSQPPPTRTRTSSGGGNANGGDPYSDILFDALLVNANTGGENVHRGSCLGAVLGATYADAAAIAATATAGSGAHDNDNEFDDEDNFKRLASLFESSYLVQGIYEHEQLRNEINNFIEAVVDGGGS